MTSRVLVLAAHPDDEILGCGGAIAKHILNGDLVSTHIIAEGSTSRDLDCHAAALSQLRKEAIEANAVLGVKDLNFHQFPDNRLDSIDRLELIKTIESIIDHARPDIIYTHHIGDVNIDHRRIHEAVVTATRPMPNSFKPTLLFFEIQSSTEWQPMGSAQPFTPNWYVDISDTLDLKIKALSLYMSEMRDWPHARSCNAIEHLAKWRGSNVGVVAAEAFILGRKIITKF